MSFSVENLTCVRSDHIVFEELSFHVPSGNALWVKGNNGAGKSSLLRICATLLNPVNGDMKWQDQSCLKYPEKYRGQFHYIGHQDALKPALTVRENLRFWAEFLGNGNIEQALRDFELHRLDNTPVGLLSAGQKKRVNLARLLVAQAPLWILDEPFSSLDQLYIDLVKTHLDRHLGDGGTILYTTHQPLSLNSSSSLVLGREVKE
jgi:heme exporter protein A